MANLNVNQAWIERLLAFYPKLTAESLLRMRRNHPEQVRAMVQQVKAEIDWSKDAREPGVST